MIIASFVAIIVSLAMAVSRSILGPTIFDRILAANLFGTNIIALIVLIGHYVGTEFYLDVALTYALINFITNIALMRYFKEQENA